MITLTEQDLAILNKMLDEVAHKHAKIISSFLQSKLQEAERAKQLAKVQEKIGKPEVLEE